ncbi:MAG: hypothetical protein DRP64_02700 [Verrucomicrobia bacterium]|nr:MAG: hypothetical protein DRP64_02700 [Verrucomicrobiota bacterium]
MPNGFYAWYKVTIRDLKNKVLPNRSQIATGSHKNNRPVLSRGGGIRQTFFNIFSTLFQSGTYF